MPVYKDIALTKSLPTIKIGSLHYLSLFAGFVVPARLTSVAVNVNYPNLGTSTPLPLVNYFAT